MTDLPSRPEVLTPPNAAPGRGDGDDGYESLAAEYRSVPGPPRSVWRTQARPVLKHGGLIARAFVMLYPLLWMIASSFKPDALIFREPGLIPSEVTLESYTAGWNALLHPFSHYLMNSAIIVAGAVLGNLISCSLAGYAFA